MLFSDVFTAEAIGIRRTSDQSNSIAYAGEVFFPDKKTMGVDIKWFKLHSVIGTALKPSAYNAQATIRPRQGFKGISEEMPLFRESMKIDERDLFEIQRAQSSNDPYLQDVLDHIFDDANNLIEGANISAERMRMNLLAPIGGKLQISIGMADNTIYSYDYDKDGEWKKTHYLELTSTDTWDKPETAKPLTDIRTGVRYLKTLGSAPAYAMMTTKTFDYLFESKQIKDSFITSTSRVVDFIDEETLKDVFRRKTGLSLILYDKQFADYDGTKKSFFPDDYVTIIGSGQLGSTHKGVTPEERTLMESSEADVYILDNGIAVATKTVYGPPVEYDTTASMLALPSFEGMDDIYVIKVK